MARPQSEKHTHRTRRIIFRITESEYLRIAYQAAAFDLKVNSYARVIALQNKDSFINAPLVSNPALIKQLHYIGHNLNQLVKNAHIFGKVSPKIELLIQRIEDLMDQAILNNEKDNT